MDKMNADSFGKMLMKNVRDKVIEGMQEVMDGNVKAPSLVKLFKKIEDCSDEQKDAIKMLLKEAVDECLFEFMVMLDENPETVNLVIYNGQENSVLHDEYDDLHELLFDWFDYYSNYDY